jgi:hypothetical protein
MSGSDQLQHQSQPSPRFISSDTRMDNNKEAEVEEDMEPHKEPQLDHPVVDLVVDLLEVVVSVVDLLEVEVDTLPQQDLQAKLMESEDNLVFNQTQLTKSLGEFIFLIEYNSLSPTISSNEHLIYIAHLICIFHTAKKNIFSRFS